MSARKLTDAQVDEAVALARQGAGAPEVAALLRVTEATGQRLIAYARGLDGLPFYGVLALDTDDLVHTATGRCWCGNWNCPQAGEPRTGHAHAPNARADSGAEGRLARRERICEAARRSLRAGMTTTTTAIAESCGCSASVVHDALKEAGLLHAVGRSFDGTATIGESRRRRP